MDRLTGHWGYVLALAATAIAGLITRMTWPLLAVAPFVLMFLAVYVTARWASFRAGVLAVVSAYAWALWLSPNAVQFSLIPASVFATIGLLATFLISSRTEALAAREASETRAIRALEETRVAEAKLRQSQKMEALGQLVAGVAHNFNNLLTITMGYADLLGDHVTREGQPHLEEIRRATDRGAKLTRQLLAITRKQDAGVTATNLNTTLEELEALLIPLIREDIALSIQLAPAPAVVMIDPQDFGQIVLNLVVNARDAMPSGGTISIDVSRVSVARGEIPATFQASPGDFVRLRVSDTGTGMPPEVLAHLFEPFFTTKDPDKGTGLGLAFSYGVVQRASGFISVASAPGKGTRVDVHLPVAAVSPPVPAAEPVAPAPPPVAAAARILVVEDEAPVRMVATRTLASAGYTVFEAASPLEARALCEREAIDVLLTDVVMPGMRGPELALMLQAQRPALKVLLMSGYQASAEDGATYPFLAKPFTRQALLDAVRSVIG